jgi:hypothetical protein
MSASPPIRSQVLMAKDEGGIIVYGIKESGDGYPKCVEYVLNHDDKRNH